LNDRAAQVLDAAGDLVSRFEEILPMRQADGRTFTDARWDQIASFRSRFDALLSARVTERQSDTSLLQLQAAAEFERLRLNLATAGV